MEDYLKAMYELQEGGEPATNYSIAKWLGIAPASVTNMIKRLAKLDLVEHEPYRGGTLTPRGREYAAKVVRHHRLIELYLTDVLGIPWDRVHAEAHRLEHAVSEYLIEHIATALDNPVHDPHGRPIPDKNGDVARQIVRKLSTISPGKSVEVASVDDEDAELLRYVGNLGLFPNTSISVLEREPFGGSLRIRGGDAEFNVGIEAAEHVWVRSH
jgi:DtxR family Mn-dependent transcriptional regulator